ncbi:UBN2_2 domain-containing protein [Cephalotus follicularis]|uniref:UBN2_2 domain-containing protein n=1 Tax=Cephalotus follicularis TaxID=3775 RepID=A0A1Q3CT42_CEPFO|nr:UBN2_2 domain-containing protein [Cephalotus follicularis]
MKFVLTVLKIAYVLDPNLHQIPEDPQPIEGQQQDVVVLEQPKDQRKKRVEDEKLGRGHILDTLSDRLYDLCTNVKSPRELSEALEFKYKAKEEGTNKILISKYLDFKIADTKHILEKVHEWQVMMNKLRILKIILPETFQVGAIIAKLPPSWKVFVKKLMYKSKDISLYQIQKQLRIEKEARKRDGKNFVQDNLMSTIWRPNRLRERVFSLV